MAAVTSLLLNHKGLIASHLYVPSPFICIYFNSTALSASAPLLVYSPGNQFSSKEMPCLRLLTVKVLSRLIFFAVTAAFVMVSSDWWGLIHT